MRLVQAEVVRMLSDIEGRFVRVMTAVEEIRNIFNPWEGGGKRDRVMGGGVDEELMME